MRIQPGALGFAAGITAALVSTICAAFLAVAPEPAITLIGLAVHQDLSGFTFTPDVTWASYFTALLFWGLGTGLIFGFAAWLYDRLISPAPERTPIQHAVAR